ncbi:hypothetical protein F441_06156 [Phytophthora nicotianae CJ01A1]|uniref:CCHC-type domain-containing protein n=1 Tax=Phytophthora nicotianae CJ01A1 TaxID=1317063 RepID=W2XBC2_PHYNI|nr:hypothetical protein F441_06156 [Phytophthora nicotianae CJ01A1]
MKPSPYYKQAERRVTRRIASAGETGNKSTYVCKTCRQGGHNRRTCRRHANKSDDVNANLKSFEYKLPHFDENSVDAADMECDAPIDSASAEMNHDTHVVSTQATPMSVQFLLGGDK